VKQFVEKIPGNRKDIKDINETLRICETKSQVDLGFSSVSQVAYMYKCEDAVVDGTGVLV